ncbi:hypothetical protein IT568_11685 [bacterium]|nr:hypothetical protein [bacterium]
MSNEKKLSRRDALKSIALGTAGILAAPIVTKITGTDDIFRLTAFGQTKAYKVVAGTKGATVSGKITYKDKVPKSVMKNVTADFEVAGKEPRVWEALNVGKSNGVKDLVVFIENAAEGKDFSKAESVLDHKGAVMIPRVGVIELVGGNGKMMLINSDPVLHQVRAIDQKGKQIKNLALPTKGMKLPLTVKEAGTIDCECAPHPWERAYRLVAQNPYYCVTGEDGSFTISDLPNGTYNLKVWGEGIKEKGGKLIKSITVSGATVTADLDLKLTDLTDELKKNA